MYFSTLYRSVSLCVMPILCWVLVDAAIRVLEKNRPWSQLCPRAKQPPENAKALSRETAISLLCITHFK